MEPIAPGPRSPDPRRIVVVGTSGAGKTTFAAAIARARGIPHVELDSLHWEPGWREAAPAVFRARVAVAVAAPAWVVDGNYQPVRDLIWPRADTVVWLDFTLPVILRRVLARTVGRALRRTELWNGNRESLRTAFLSRDSIVLWALTTYRRRRREYPRLLAAPAHAHLHVVRLRTPRAAAAWLARLAARGPVAAALPDSRPAGG